MIDMRWPTCCLDTKGQNSVLIFVHIVRIWLMLTAVTCKCLANACFPNAVGENDKDGVRSLAQVRLSIGTALGAAALNAKLLADQEERKMEHLMTDIIENQVGACFDDFGIVKFEVSY